MSQKKNITTFPYKESVYLLMSQILTFPNHVFHIRDLSKRTGLSTTAVLKAVAELAEHDVIRVEKSELSTNIQANLESERYVSLKRAYNIDLISRTGLLQAIRKLMHPEAVAVFGSYARGEDVETSDIDILVLSSAEGSYDLLRFEEKMRRKISLHILPSLDKSEAEFKNSVANGIVLYGYVKAL